MQFTIMNVDWGPYQCEMFNSNQSNNNNLGNVDICGRPSILTIDMREWRRRRKCDSESVSDNISNSIKTKNCHQNNWQLNNNNNTLQSRILNNNMGCLPNRTDNCHPYSKLNTLLGSPPPKLCPERQGVSRHNSSSMSMCLCVMILLLCCGVSAQLRPDTDIISHRQSEEGVCRNVDIRNNVTTFKRLAGCRVVEGYVQILLMDADDKEEEYLKTLSFPELREITGYLLLYRVQGLRSLARLFPNLTVIRGHTLFYNYALVIFEMRHLQEVGLSSLTHIQRGSVRIEKNPLLCYVDTVDWDLIAHAGKGEHFISGNKRRNECPICPTNQHCPKSPTTNDRLCWTHQNCQQVCPEHCGTRSCTSDGRCCHDLCLAGCSGEGPNPCLVCRDVVFKNKCISHCPVNTYKYLNRRCVEEAECRNMPVNHDLEMPRANQWKPFNNSCILECPANHVEVPVEPKIGNITSYTCKPCNGSCRKECIGASLDSIASAQKFRGCTYIKGSLEIQIRGGKNIVKELEESLYLIEEIEGYLKIVRSFPLISLNFLKNLTIIHGKELDNNRDAFIVRDNQNLQELWDWGSKPKGLKIKQGKLFFHFNPKLCLYKIKELQENSGLSEYTDSEVARDSNGDKMACNVTELTATVAKKESSAVLIEWQPFIYHDPRALLGYVLYYMEAPSQNITLYDGRDACGGDGWFVDDVSVQSSADDDSSPSSLIHILTQLKPFTQYAFYVKTYTLATEGAGAQSKLQYFRTLPDIPSMPISLKAYSNSSSEIVIQWLPPLEPNGNVTHYLIEAFWEKIDPEFLEQRDYCTEPLMLPDKKPPVPTPPPTSEEDKKTATVILDEKGTCACDEKDKKSTQLKEKEIQFQIMFENFLHNTVYVKSSTSRKKREVLNFSMNSRNKGAFDMKKDLDKLSYREFPETPEKDNLATAQPPSPTQESSVSIVKGKYHIYRSKVQSSTVVIKPLRHFAEYTISVSACREIDPEESKDKKPISCSTKSIVTARTLKLDSADNMDQMKLSVEVANQTQEFGGEVRLKWEEPIEPNGIVVTYHIEYRRVDIQNYKPTVECITRKQYMGWDGSYTLKNLQPGNYSLRLRATSLAGNGAYTPIKYFLIENPPSAPAMQVKLVVILITLLFLIPLSCGLYIYLQRRKRLDMAKRTLITTVNPEYVSTVYVPDEWEVPRKKIELIKELGQGSFGMVYEGLARDIQGIPEIKCAIKTVGTNASDRERIEFLNEASVMKEFKTQHVVRLLGVVSQGCPNQPALVVMELMAHGDLKSYLRKHRPSESSDPACQPPSLKRILQMAIEISDGMSYLAAKKFVHRDLAARNCMVAEDLTVKIGDFGMTRDIYETDYYRKDTKGLLPVRWMAPESLKDGIFTSFSDVWSYGVVLWEMATLASQPYQGLSNDQVLRYVIEGGVMEPPENCPKKLYEMMRLCWQHRPQTRPSFMELVSRLLSEVGPDFAEVSFFHSEPAKEVREQARIAAAAKEEKAASPSTPLRIAHDIEDFSLGSGSEPESDEEAGEAAALTAHSPPRNFHPTRPTTLSDPLPNLTSVTIPDNCSPNAPPLGVYSSDSSRGSKVSNGSTANGFINRHNSGPTSVKTTEC